MKKPERILYAISAIIMLLMVIALIRQFAPSSGSRSNADQEPTKIEVSNAYISKYAGGYTVELEGLITISIRGNTGIIREVFRQRNGKFYSNTSSDRYLMPTKNN